MTTEPIAPNLGNQDHPVFSNSLASLRGLAASFVVIYHGFLLLRVNGFDFPQRQALDFSDPYRVIVHALIGFFNGPAAVVLFFVLSGTVLTLSFKRSSGSQFFHLLAYYVRRAFRLYPLLIAVTLFSAAMHWFWFTDKPIDIGTSWMNNYFTHVPNLKEIVLNAVGYSNSLNSPAWTIRIEIVASVLMPLFIFLTRRPIYICATFAVLLALMYAPLKIGHVNVYMISFFLGALIPVYGRTIANIYASAPIALRYASVIGAVFAGMFTQRIFRPWIHVDPSSVLVVSLAAAFIVTVTYYGRRQNGWLNSKSLIFLGEISYGLYLLHFIILFMFMRLLAPYLGAAPSPELAIAAMFGVGLLTLLVTIPLATATFYFLEKPLQNMGRKYSRKLQAMSSKEQKPHTTAAPETPSAIN